MMSGSDSWANGDKEVRSSSSGNWRQFLNFSSEKEGDSDHEPSSGQSPAFQPTTLPPMDQPASQQAPAPAGPLGASSSSSWTVSCINKWLYPEGVPKPGARKGSFQSVTGSHRPGRSTNGGLDFKENTTLHTHRSPQKRICY